MPSPDRRGQRKGQQKPKMAAPTEKQCIPCDDYMKFQVFNYYCQDQKMSNKIIYQPSTIFLTRSLHFKVYSMISCVFNSGNRPFLYFILYDGMVCPYRPTSDYHYPTTTLPLPLPQPYHPYKNEKKSSKRLKVKSKRE